MLKALDGRLAKFKMPKRVIVVDELPRNAMGKVQKNILRDTYADIYGKISVACPRVELDRSTSSVYCPPNKLITNRPPTINR